MQFERPRTRGLFFAHEDAWIRLHTQCGSRLRKGMLKMLKLTTTAAGALIGACVLGASIQGGCATTYYKTMEMFGKEKRDILASRVQSAKDGQADAKKQFQSTLDRFSALVNADGGDLKPAYERAKSDLESSESKAQKVRDRIASVESVGGDLFKEWEAELGQYSSADLRSRSEQQLRDTRTRYDEMLGAMKRAESKMEPVLSAFRDNVLSLKHSLNAQAVASMRGTVLDLEREIASLIAEMERSMAEADRFVQGLK